VTARVWQWKWREGKVRPVPGNPPHDRLVSRGIGSLRRICDDPFSATSFQLQRTIPWPAVCVFLGMAESFDPMWSKSKPKPKSKPKTTPWGGAVPPPAGRPLAQVQERAGRITPSSSFSMSSGRLILDRVARQHCPSPLHRRAQTNMHFIPNRRKQDISTLQRIGHFYFALT